MTVSEARSPVQEVDCLTLQNWLREHQAILVDVREPDEYRREHIPGTNTLVPLSNFDLERIPNRPDKKLVLYCKSSRRSGLAAQELLKANWTEVAHLQGGITAWKAAGYPTQAEQTAPMNLMRQAQLGAGSIVLTSSILGGLVSPWFLLLSGAVGASLIIAGLTNMYGLGNWLTRWPVKRQDGAS